MPNHVTNRIYAPAEALSKFITTTKDGDPYFDFNALIPAPQSFARNYPHKVRVIARITMGLIKFPSPDELGSVFDVLSALKASSAYKALAEEKMANSLSDEDFESLITVLRSFREHGCLSQLDWNRVNWGTKWNSYQVRMVFDDLLEFQTAWSPPHPVIGVLAEKLATGLSHEWADEDTGYNCKEE